ncbi:acyltransferase [Cellulosimicrobium marinum]|uniref:acyltransferase n=1 Tax=Cellulosimicrobium marinum TaxID=1638992 RepID=UPI001E3EC4CA|nr:acyltransferase [Cellulosimicrobium marinum]MCB7137198.1 acyltransferase [Cellulosimicrobium marinum]
MPTTIRELAPYADDLGNRIEFAGEHPTGPATRVDVLFAGERNVLVVDPSARFKRLSVRFDCSDGTVHLGGGTGRAIEVTIRVGQDATVTLGERVTTTSVLLISAVEGATVTVGDDVMFASANQLRSDDGHPIFDVRSGLRVNPARDITIGDHVWMGREAVALGGASVGSGSVVGFRSLVTGRIPNNVVAAGVPARVLRRDVAWERPHLSLHRPFYKPDASTVTRSPYWDLTDDDGAPVVGRAPASGRRSLTTRLADAARAARDTLRS